jgi:hypothetical protein
MDGKMNIENVTSFGRSFSIVRVPYSLKLLIHELQALNIQMRVITEDNIDQLMSMSYSDNINKLVNLEDKNKPLSELISIFKEDLSKLKRSETKNVEQQYTQAVKDQQIEFNEETLEDSPQYQPYSPPYSPVSPPYAPGSPAYNPNSPPYAPGSPAYNPNSPPYAPGSPAYNPNSPPYAPGSPTYHPTSPPYAPSSPAYNPNSPTYHPTYPTYETSSSQSSPLYSPHTPPGLPPPLPEQTTTLRQPNIKNEELKKQFESLSERDKKLIMDMMDKKKGLQSISTPVNTLTNILEVSEPVVETKEKEETSSESGETKTVKITLDEK